MQFGVSGQTGLCAQCDGWMSDNLWSTGQFLSVDSWFVEVRLLEWVVNGQTACITKYLDFDC